MRTALPLALAAALLALSAPLFAADKAKCAVKGEAVTVTAQTPRVYVQGKPLYFCCATCSKAFVKSPEQYVKTLGACPVLSADITAAKAEERVVINNALWYVCCTSCVDGVKANTVVLKDLEDVVTKKKFRGSPSSLHSDYRGQVYFFENAQSKAAFDKEPARYAVIFGR